MVIEKSVFPRDKVCGGCVSPSGMVSLRRMGLEQAIRRVSSPINSFSLAARGRQLNIALAEQGVAIGRDVLDSMLLEHAVATGAVAWTGAGANLRESGDDGCQIEVTTDAESKTIHARNVIVSDGLAGTFLPRDEEWDARVAPGSYFGVGTRLAPGLGKALCESGTIAMRCGQAGYFGAVRLSDGSIDVAAALSPEKTKELGGPGRVIQGLAVESGLAAEGDVLANARWRGTPLLTRRRCVEKPGIFVIGDAAGYVEPFTGEGMSWALAAGLAVANHAQASVSGAYRMGDWTRKWKLLAERRRIACRATALALRRPMLVAASIAIANALPAAANIVASVVSGPWHFSGTETVRA